MKQNKIQKESREIYLYARIFCASYVCIYSKQKKKSLMFNPV